MVWRKILDVFEGKQKGTITPIPERPCPLKLFSMHFTSTSTCMNFLADSIFWPPWTIVHGPKGNLGRFWRQAKRNHNGTITWYQRGHAHQNCFPCISCQLLLAWIFWANSIFWLPWTIVHGLKGNFGRFWRQAKRNHNSDTGEAMPTKIGFHAFHFNLYLHDFLKPILFFDPHGL